MLTSYVSVMHRLGLVAGLGLTCLAGCHSVHVDAPAGFAGLEPGDDIASRSVSPEGVVFAVRREKNDIRGDLAFWSGAIDAKLRREGYRAYDAKDVVAKGVKGKEIRYGIDRAGREHTYAVTVFVTETTVVTVEAGGDHELFAKQAAGIAKATATLDIE